MPFSYKTAVVLVLSLFIGVTAARAQDEIPLVCEFRQSVGLAFAGPFSPKRDVSRFSFLIPMRWYSRSSPDFQTTSLRWINLNQGWDGNATAILQSKMITIVEKVAASDNVFVVHVWLEKPSLSGAFEAVYFMAGHSALPKEYEASRLSVGKCGLGSSPK
jgi:hypothetical protein